LMNGAAVIPLHWGAKQKGMQADNEIDAEVIVGFGSDDYIWDKNEVAWLLAKDDAVKWATAFMNAGYHKQVYNRLLEPFLHIDTLVTATEYQNFLWLRDHKDAEPHIKILAQKVK